MNLGLTSSLKEAFPDIILVRRPLVVTPVIYDPNWVSGFTSGEGLFFIQVYKAKTKIGSAIKLIFTLTQHKRDE